MFWQLESLTRILPAGEQHCRAIKAGGPGSEQEVGVCDVTLGTDSQPTEKLS